MKTNNQLQKAITENLKNVEEGKPLTISLAVLNGAFKEEYRKKFGEFERLDDTERKARLKAYHKSDKWKAYWKEYQKLDKYKAYWKEYQKSDKYKAYKKAYQKSDKYKAYKKAYYQRKKGEGK